MFGLLVAVNTTGMRVGIYHQSRHNVIYGYLPTGPCGHHLVDTRNGEAIDVAEFAAQREIMLLRLWVDSQHCFVSDLDLYDAVRELVESGDVRSDHAERYWSCLTPLDVYGHRRLRRPEVMIAADVGPSDVEVMSGSQ
ncbi:hypothetical protein [Mycobacterium hubeiense]|uniref:hypothetical protein n=1 Tax=Mycobacterium hubeiense TaxID=1867256 RepID=UPI001E56A9E6|nr:hypothetical protein [Mycobacterium sp. QGD 101]